MPKSLTILLASLLWLGGCTAAEPVNSLAAIGTETQAPPAAARRTIDAAVSHWARDRFTPGTPRWFVLKPGLPGVAVMKAIDNGLGGRARRFVETGPDGSNVTLYGWRLSEPAAEGHDALIAVVSHGDPAIAAYLPATLSGQRSQ